jgi:hypothetical protein
MSVQVGIDAWYRDFNKSLVVRFHHLTSCWKKVDLVIKTYDECPAEICMLQKKYYTNEMKLINALRIKNIVLSKSLLETLRKISLDIMDLFDLNINHDVPENLYLDTCNALKENIDNYEKVVEILTTYLSAKQK